MQQGADISVEYGSCFDEFLKESKLNKVPKNISFRKVDIVKNEEEPTEPK